MARETRAAAGLTARRRCQLRRTQLGSLPSSGAWLARQVDGERDLGDLLRHASRVIPEHWPSGRRTDIVEPGMTLRWTITTVLGLFLALFIAWPVLQLVGHGH